MKTAIMHHKKFIWLFIFTGFVLFGTFRTFGQEPKTEGKEEILIITSYNSDTKYTYDNINAFTTIYQAKGGHYPTVVENMNIISLRQYDQWSAMVAQIIDRHPQIRLLILLGGEAWCGFLNLPDEKYKKIPTICAMGPRHGIEFPPEGTEISTYETKSIDLIEKMKAFNVQACYAYEYHIDKDISLIKSFYPNTRQLAFLSDNTYNGLIQRSLLKKEMAKYPELKTTFIDGRTLTLDSAVEQVKELPANTSLLLGIWRIDNREMAYINNSVYAFTKANPILPVFSLTATGVGYWAIGGYVPKYNGVPENMAQKAYQILEQHQSNVRELNSLPCEYLFDAAKLKELGFENKTLPANSRIINQKQTLFETYRNEARAILASFTALLLGLFASLYYYLKMKALKNRLEISSWDLRNDKKKLEKSEIDLRHAKELAEESNKLKSAFVANMSHEIRTPLNSIVGFSNLLINSINCTEEQKEYAAIVQNNSDLLLQLINDILDVSRLESGKLQLNYEWCDMVVHCQNMVALVNQNKKTNTEVRFDTSSASYLLYTDPMRLQQIMINLLNNALKFTPQEGSIVLSFKTDSIDNCILFSVTDTGCGIPEKMQQQVFKRFEKLNEFVQGTGLGLSICKLTIQHMGGDIWVDKSYTTGARFVFSHPITEKK